MTATLTPRTGTAPFVLVTGGKGGVGKTALAANLGIELARVGRDPLVCDLDFALANLDVVLGVPAPFTARDVLDGTRPLEDCVVEAPGGIHILAAGSGSWARSTLGPLERVRLHAAAVESPAEIVVGDSPAGIGDDVLDFAALADRVLVVTTPEPAAVTDAYGVIKAIDAFARDRQLEVPTPEVFVNMVRDAAEARIVIEKLSEVCERFLARVPRFAGWMPRSRAVLRGAIEQRPFVLQDPKCLAARQVGRLARRYAQLCERRRPTPAPNASARDGR